MALEFRRGEAEKAVVKLRRPYRRPGYPGSAALFASIAAMFAVELRTAAPGNDAALLRLGALPDSGGLHHQYWRLLTFGFLHSNLIHIVLNVALLIIAGPVVERRAGAWRVILIFFAASVASGVGIFLKHQLWPSSGVSVGASGGMFGLLAAALVLVFRARSASRPARAGLLLVLCLGLAYSLLPGVSMVGHVIGLAVGAMLALAIHERSTAEGPDFEDKVGGRR
jgi:membrane associated rhomboid family serine protease